MNQFKFLLGLTIIGINAQLSAMEPASHTEAERTHVVSKRKYSRYNMDCKAEVKNTFRYYDLAEFIDTTNIVRYFCERTFDGDMKKACEEALFEYKYILMERKETYESDPEVQKELQRVRTQLNYFVSYE